MARVKTVGLKKYYGNEENLVKALDGIDISVEAGEFVSILGSSGSGKTTLLNMLGGLDWPSEGKVIIDETDISLMKQDDLTIFRRRNIGFIFQSYNLLPILSSYENIVLPLQLDGQEIDRGYINRIIHLLKIEDKVKNFPHEMSGGQQQRVAIARALAMKPSIILADEPTGNLDSKTGREVVELLGKMSRELCQTVVMITHNEILAKEAERILQIEDGKICNQTIENVEM